MGSVRLSTSLESRVKEVAQRRGITRSEVFRTALESYCEKELSVPLKSRWDDVIGIIDAPSDCSVHV